MKKIGTWLFILMVALTLSACNQKTDPPPADPTLEQDLKNPADTEDQAKDASIINLDSAKIDLSALTKQDGSLTLTVTCDELEPIYESEEEITFYWDLWALDRQEKDIFHTSAIANSQQEEAPDGKWRINLLEAEDEDAAYSQPIIVTGDNSISLIWTRMLSEEVVDQIAQFEVRLAVSIGDEMTRSDLITFGRDAIENVMK